MPNRITIYTDNLSKSYTFRVKSRTELQEWTQVVWFYIEKTRQINWKSVMPKISGFNKFRMMTIKEFKNKASTGDILLFTSSLIGSKIQRLVTRSRFGIFYLIYIKRSCCLNFEMQK